MSTLRHIALNLGSGGFFVGYYIQALPNLTVREDPMDSREENKQFLTFKLSEEQYGLNVLQVREVLEIPRITRVPRMPVYMRGVINIRGAVVPVIDLRLKLGLEESERSANSRVVIIEVENGQETIVVGMLVDSVQEVNPISNADISPPPQIGTQIEAEFILGIAKLNDNFVIIINISRIFSSQEMQNLAGSAEQSSNSVEATV